jgi:hypothetical protein
MNASAHLTQDDVRVYLSRRGCAFTGSPVQFGTLHAWHCPDGAWRIWDITAGRWVRRGER